MLPQIAITDEDAARLRRGLFLHRPGIDHAPGTELAALDARGELVAVVSIGREGELRLVKVCAAPSW